MADKKALVATENIESKILLIRGHCERVELKAPGTRRHPPCGEKVMLGADLAELYGVDAKVLNQAVKRNIERFPTDFMFQLTAAEKIEVVTNCDHLDKLKLSTPSASSWPQAPRPKSTPSALRRGKKNDRGVTTRCNQP